MMYRIYMILIDVFIPSLRRGNRREKCK